MRETKLRIPLTLPDGTTISIVGILAQQHLDPRTSLPPSSDGSSSKDSGTDKPGGPNRPTYAETPVDPTTTRNRPVALILHGVLAHKDQTFHRPLASALPLDSFRFDFRANAETPGTWNMASFDDDQLDIDACVAYLRDQLGYTIEMVVAHSRGALDAWKWFADRVTDDAGEAATQRVPFLVALAGRWRMERIHDRDALYQPSFERDGFYRWNVKVAGQARSVHIYPADVKAFASWPIADYVSRFPLKTDVLMIQGTADEVVPVADASYYINALTAPPRRSGSAMLHLIDDADHNFKGHYDEVVQCIVSWFQQRLKMADEGKGAKAIRDGEVAGNGAAAGGVEADQKALLQRRWEENKKGKL